jgi:hypothetical protein
LIRTLAITLLIESPLVAGYALWRKKPLVRVLLSSICANLVTQSLLWLALNLFVHRYLVTLFIGEICIVGMEAAILYIYRRNQLKLREALLLSLVINLASFAAGWFLPV